MSRSQCEGCNGYADAMYCLCSECSDKAASYDITALERKELITAVGEALLELRKLSGLNDDAALHVSRAKGWLGSVLESCKRGQKESEVAK